MLDPKEFYELFHGDNRRQALKDAIALHRIEGNPLTDEEIAMFEMFDTEGLNTEQRMDYLRKHLGQLGVIHDGAYQCPWHSR